MEKKNSVNNQTERRVEDRSADEQYYSVQFSVKGVASHYQFKIWNISSKGLCILVKNDSAIVEFLNVGDILNMTYYIAKTAGGTARMKTKIQHITKNDSGKFKGHYLVGLSII